MKILQVNKFYYPRDGVGKYVLELEERLKESGHEVRIFAMDNPLNISSPDKKYFVSYLSFNQKGLKNIWRSFARIFYSLEAKRKFKSLVNDFKPDIIHVHNIYHQISPSILTVAKKKKIPVIMHLHDYKLICPNYKLFIKGKTCQRCHGGKYYNCFLNKCLKESYLKSLGGTLEMYFHHKIWKIYKTGVNLFIAPSQFMKKTCEDFAWPEKKIKYVCNFFTGKITNQPPKEEDNYLLYFGRLSAEKGINLILQALTFNQETLKIAGEGPEIDNLKSLTKKLSLEERVEFLGFKSGTDLNDLIIKAKAIIIPSVWFENMPLNLLESLAQGKIVIAAKIGGIPEIIEDGHNGFLFNPSNVQSLVEKIKQVNELDLEEIKNNALETVKKLNPRDHCQEIIKIYKTLIDNK